MKRIILCITAMIMVFMAAAQQHYTEDAPRAMLAGKSCCMITIEEISAAGKLQCSNPNLHIINFAMTMVNDGVLVSRVANGDKITASMMEKLRQLNKGQKFIVDGISAIKASGEIIKIKSLSFTLN